MVAFKEGVWDLRIRNDIRKVLLAGVCFFGLAGSANAAEYCTKYLLNRCSFALSKTL